MIEIIVRLEDELYEQCKNTKLTEENEGFDFHIIKSVANGTPLPKGHGDLIDRGELKTHFIGTEQETDLEVYLEPTIINAPPIIKADKGE